MVAVWNYLQITEALATTTQGPPLTMTLPHRLHQVAPRSLALSGPKARWQRSKTNRDQQSTAHGNCASPMTVSGDAGTINSWSLNLAPLTCTDGGGACAVGPALSINDVSKVEGNSGTTNASFTVTLSPASTQTVTVKYATANGTATAGSDYTAKALTTLTFAPTRPAKR